MKTSLSGIKAPGIPHLGNILGMILPAIALQKTHNTFYFVADLHALTTVQDPVKLKKDIFEVAASFLAFGLNPEHGAFFRQSDLPEHTELMWLLSCAVSMGDLTRAHAYKAAKDKGEEGKMSFGTFSYPVLMAADILLYDADVVPVGKDQLQHIEMARAIAQRFNFHFGETFKEPQELIQQDMAVVPGIDGRKMSKSYGNGIEPLLPIKEVKKQIMAIVSDSKGLEDVKDPETCNIFALYKLFATTSEQAEMAAKYRAGGFGYGHAKLALLEKIDKGMAEPRARFEEIKKDPSLVENFLKKGAEKARPRAKAVLLRARKACGLA